MPSLAGGCKRYAMLGRVMKLVVSPPFCLPGASCGGPKAGPRISSDQARGGIRARPRSKPLRGGCPVSIAAGPNHLPSPLTRPEWVRVPPTKRGTTCVAASQRQPSCCARGMPCWARPGSAGPADRAQCGGERLLSPKPACLSC